MGVRVACREILSAGSVQDIQTEAALERWRGGDGSFWIVLDTDAPDEAASWLRARGLALSGLETFLDPNQGRVLQLLDDVVLFRRPEVASDDPGAVATTTFVSLDRLLIEIRHHSSGSDAIESGLPGWQHIALPEASTSGLVCALLILHSAALLAVAATLRADARRLSARMDEDPDSVSLGEIVNLKRRIRGLDEANDDQEAVLAALKVLRRPGLDLVRLADFFQEAITHSQSCDRAVDRLTTQAADLKSSFDACQQGKLNRRLGLLTIVSAVFLPLSLLAGIYGMNFDVMPELHLPFGYPALLLVMAFIAVWLLWYFWSRGWFSDL